jgi:catechol 2,3-dioxygenase-like lactoylglutathione lyase family enzyme
MDLRLRLLLLALPLASLTLAAPASAQEGRDWKREPWYSPEKYPDAPFLREGTYSQKPLQGKLLRVKRPLVIVSDLERSLRFYVDVLGLELYSVEPYFDRNPESLGYEMFGLPPGVRKRMAMLNTSDEVRGLTLQEVRDMPVEFKSRPRAFTVLFETDDLLGIRARAKAAGHRVIEPALGDIPSTATTPALRFMEFAVIDPDDHVISFFQYFPSDEAWAAAQRAVRGME